MAGPLKTRSSETAAVEDLDSLVFNLTEVTSYFDYFENRDPETHNLCVIYRGSSPKQEMAAAVAYTTISSWMRPMTEQLPQWSKW